MAKKKIKPIILPEYNTNFNILPSNLFHPIVYFHLKEFPRNFLERNAHLESRYPLYSPIAGMLSTPNTSVSFCWSKEKSLALRNAVKRIMRARFLFRKLLHHARTKKLSKVNTTDLYTGEVPKKPINITDWKGQHIYTFEAQTLMKDITLRLTHHDGFFEFTQPPRNLFTNEPLTQSQIIGVWNSLNEAGIPVSTAFVLFRRSRYNLDKYVRENIVFLKITALRNIMNTPSCYDYNERMLDFIKYSYHVESIDCDLSIYKFVMYNKPDHSIILKWKKLCYRYYESEILYQGNTIKIDQIKDGVLDDTYELLENETALRNFKNLYQDLS